jgi:chorismate--pyruvate lyase
MKHPRAPHWFGRKHYRELSIPAGISDWLTDPSSLTARLQRACPGAFEVRLLGQHRTRPDHSEARALGLRLGVEVVSREVQLLCGGVPVVFARSVIPFRTLHGRHRRLAFLGERPLGAYLFAQRALVRDQVELSCIRPGEKLYEIATAGIDTHGEYVWGRRSLFRLGRKRLLVSEFFLPTLLRLSS